MEGPESGWTVVIADDHPLVRDAMRHALTDRKSVV